MTPRLTANYGVRWEPYFPQVLDDKRIYNWDYSRFKQRIKSTVFKNAPAGFYQGLPNAAISRIERIMYAVLKRIPSPFENRIRNSGGTISLSGAGAKRNCKAEKSGF